MGEQNSSRDPVCSLWGCIHFALVLNVCSQFSIAFTVFSFILHYYFLKPPFRSFESLFVSLSLTSLPASPFSHLFILTLSPRSARHIERDGRRGRRPEIDVGPAHMETGSWLNRSDRSGTEHFLCQTAGPLWKEIISKLLQEADACQKMLSVKVRLLHCCLSPPLSPSVTLLLSSFS